MIDKIRKRAARLPPEAIERLGQRLREQFGLLSELEPLPADLVALTRRLQARLAEQQQSTAEQLREALVASIPALRSFALSLTYSQDRADDLVQDTLVRAWAKADSFTPGTHLIAWLFTILRNLFYSEQRKRRREIEDVDGAHAGRLIALPDHEIRLELADFRTALDMLPLPQREALILVGAQGFSYDEAAAICGVAVGTIKSRVNRGRTLLVQRLGMESTGDIGLDAISRASSGTGRANHG